MSGQQLETLESALVVIWSGLWRFILVGVSMTEMIQAWAGILLTLLTIGYTLYKWRRDVLKDRKADVTSAKAEKPEELV